MRYLYVSARVESRISALQKAGKAGAVLAKKTTHIIACLTSGAARNHMEVPVSFTKYGEKRIKNCRKYDLGNERMEKWGHRFDGPESAGQQPLRLPS